jgi:hypothetical protein
MTGTLVAGGLGIGVIATGTHRAHSGIALN